MKLMEKSDKIYRVVTEIPVGRIMTYGQIGKIVGINPRLVGRILHQNPSPEAIPCHRVVSATGRVAESYAFGGGTVQMEILKEEGVIFIGSRINMKKCLYKRNH